VKKVLALVFLALATNIYCVAQQKPQFTQYIFNNYLLNPAISGIENYTDIKAGYRRQWSGIENAPTTTFVSANWKLGDDYLWKNPLSLPDNEDNPMSRNYTQNYTASPAHHGMGVIAMLDEAGPISRLDVNLTYAYHLKVSDRYNLSVGLGAGISNINLDINQLTLENTNDPALTNTIQRQLKPDLNIGTWFYGPKLFIGASIQQILPQKLAFGDAGKGKEVPHFFLTTGYKVYLDDEIFIVPSFMFKKVNAIPLGMDANLKISFKDRFWLGASYRKNDSYSALAGFNFSKLINLTYSYDVTTSALNTVSNGSHEIVLGLQLNNVYKVLSNMRMW
jgi:type IX secretion system PorP/SprF family membrane protein